MATEIDDFDAVVKAAAARRTTYPSSFQWAVSLVTERVLTPDDKEAFRDFQRRVLEQYGAELRVIAGGYGCTKLVVRLDGETNPEAAAQFILALLRDRTVELPQQLEFTIARLHNPPVEVNLKTGEIKNAELLRAPVIIYNYTTLVKNVEGSQIVVASENVRQEQEETPADTYQSVPGKLETTLAQLEIHLASSGLEAAERTKIRKTIKDLADQLLGKANSEAIYNVNWRPVEALIKSIKKELPAIYDINRRLRRIHQDLKEDYAVAVAKPPSTKIESKSNER